MTHINLTQVKLSNIRYLLQQKKKTNHSLKIIFVKKENFDQIIKCCFYYRLWLFVLKWKVNKINFKIKYASRTSIKKRNLKKNKSKDQNKNENRICRIKIDKREILKRIRTTFQMASGVTF